MGHDDDGSPPVGLGARKVLATICALVGVAIVAASVILAGPDEYARVAPALGHGLLLCGLALALFPSRRSRARDIAAVSLGAIGAIIVLHGFLRYLTQRV